MGSWVLGTGCLSKFTFIKVTILIYNVDSKDKTKVLLERELANRLKSMKKVGETYSDVIWKLLEVK